MNDREISDYLLSKEIEISGRIHNAVMGILQYGHNSERGKSQVPDILNGKPDWCPLRDFPEKKTKNKYHNDYEKGVVDGFNSCVDEILKGANWNE